MRNLKKLILSVFIFGFVTATHAQQVNTLLTKPLPEAPGKEIEVITVDYAPGAVDAIHRHDAHAVVYVLDGEVEMQVRGDRLRRLGPGQVFYEARNTATGLLGVPGGLREAGTALGLTPAQRWRAVDVRLALPTIMAGIGTAAVITVGTATIAAFVGAGGLGDRIVTGLALNDHAMLLAGAVPAAALALAVQGLFALIERLATPRSQP